MPPDYTPRRLGTFTSQDLNRTPTGSSLMNRPTPSGEPIDYGFSVTSSRPMTPLRRAAPQPGQSLDQISQDYEPGSFGMQNALANAGIYRPGTFAAQNARANRTGYTPPQQTERANPLSGDNNIPMESTTTVLRRPPFVQRGVTIPRGQDTSPIRTTRTIDSDISRELNPSPIFRRAFNAPRQNTKAYDDFVDSLYSPKV